MGRFRVLRHVGDMTSMTPTPNPVSNPNPRANRPRLSRLMAAVIPASHAMPAPNQRMARIAKSIGQHLRKVGPTRILLRIVVIGFVALVISGIGHALLHPARNEPNEAARLVRSLTEERATLASVPTSFDSNLSYRPVAVAGTWSTQMVDARRQGGSAPSRSTLPAVPTIWVTTFFVSPRPKVTVSEPGLDSTLICFYTTTCSKRVRP